MKNLSLGEFHLCLKKKKVNKRSSYLQKWQNWSYLCNNIRFIPVFFVGFYYRHNIMILWWLRKVILSGRAKTFRREDNPCRISTCNAEERHDAGSRTRFDVTPGSFPGALNLFRGWSAKWKYTYIYRVNRGDREGAREKIGSATRRCHWGGQG